MCAAEAKQYGFTLAEVAVVLLIVGLLLGGLLGTYSTHIYPGCAGPPATAAGTTPEFTTMSALRTGLTDGCINTPGPDLRVCTTAAAPTPLSGVGTPSATCYGTSTTLTTSAVAVIFSVGKNGVPGGTGGAAGSDESFNLDADRVFISHNPTPAGASGGEFDDILIWLSSSILYNRI